MNDTARVAETTRPADETPAERPRHTIVVHWDNNTIYVCHGSYTADGGIYRIYNVGETGAYQDVALVNTAHTRQIVIDPDTDQCPAQDAPLGDEAPAAVTA